MPRPPSHRWLDGKLTWQSAALRAAAVAELNRALDVCRSDPSPAAYYEASFLLWGVAEREDPSLLDDGAERLRRMWAASGLPDEWMWTFFVMGVRQRQQLTPLELRRPRGRPRRQPQTYA
jgi:hypothetical protein